MKNKVEVTESDSESDIGLVSTSQVLAVKGTLKLNHWIIDSGATCDICNDEQMFPELKSLKRTQSVILEDSRLEATARGVVESRLVLPDGIMKGCQPNDVFIYLICHISCSAYPGWLKLEESEERELVLFELC